MPNSRRRRAATYALIVGVPASDGWNAADPDGQNGYELLDTPGSGALLIAYFAT